MAKKDWGNKSGFDKTKDEVFELMLAESGVKKTEKKAEESGRDKKWKIKSGFDKTKDQIAELMILESSRNTKVEKKDFADASENVNLIRERGTAFMAEQERMKRQQMQEGSIIAKKYEEKDFTDSKIAKEMCFGSVESPLEVQARKISLNKADSGTRTEQIFQKAGTAYLGKFNILDLQDKEKLDLEVSKTLNAEVHFRNLGYRIDFN